MLTQEDNSVILGCRDAWKVFSTFLVKMLPDLPFLGPISLLEELCDPPLKSNDIISLCFPDTFSFFSVDWGDNISHHSVTQMEMGVLDVADILLPPRLD